MKKLLFLGISFFTGYISAETSIFLKNDLPYALNLSYEKDLADDHVEHTGPSSVGPNQKVTLWTFNRNIGIKSGKKYLFTVTVTDPDKKFDIILKQELKGTWGASNLKERFKSKSHPKINTEYRKARYPYHESYSKRTFKIGPNKIFIKAVAKDGNWGFWGNWKDIYYTIGYEK